MLTVSGAGDSLRDSLGDGLGVIGGLNSRSLVGVFVIVSSGRNIGTHNRLFGLSGEIFAANVRHV